MVPSILIEWAGSQLHVPAPAEASDLCRQQCPCVHGQGLRNSSAAKSPCCSSRGLKSRLQHMSVSGSFGNCTIHISIGKTSDSEPNVGVRNSLTARGRALPASWIAELRPWECEAGLGRCTALPLQGQRAERAWQSLCSQTSVPAFHPQVFFLGPPPTLALPSSGSHLCSTLRSPCPVPRGEGSCLGFLEESVGFRSGCRDGLGTPRVQSFTLVGSDLILNP